MSRKLIWVGPRESDTLYSGIEFFRSITFNGKNTENSIAFTSRTGVRIDHISHGGNWHLNEFLKKEISRFLDDPEVSFLFYNPMQSYTLGADISTRTLCANNRTLLEFFRDKANMRNFAQDCIPVVPYVHFAGQTLPAVNFAFDSNDGYILQHVFSSGGHGTRHMSLEECKQYVATGLEHESYILSPYLKCSAPVNVHIVVFNQKSLVLPPSYQLIQHHGQNFSYLGGDFHTDFSKELYSLIYDRSMALAEKLRTVGFRGVCGIDYLLADDQLYFLEMNPRFQASSFLLNKQLCKAGKPSLHQLNLLAFSGEEPPFESFMTVCDPESFFTVFGDHIPTWLENANSHLPPVISEIIEDGFSPDMKLEPDAYLCRAISSENLCWRDQDSRLQLAPNIQRDACPWRNKILSMEPLALKIGLLNQGVRFSTEANRRMEQQGTIRAGVFQSVDLTLENSLIVNAPYHTRFSEISPYCIEWDGAQTFLTYEGISLCQVTFDMADPYRNNIASGGTLFRNAAFWATDRLRVHHQFRCEFKKTGRGCRFCNVKLKTGSFSLEDVCEVIDFYLEHTDFRHFLIGGGSGSDEQEPEDIITLARYIRNKSQKSIYAMCLPPRDLHVLSRYHEAGINEISFNLELFDRKIARKLMPGKGSIPLSQYEAAYLEAVRLWGRDGAVRSLLVLGLEPLESFYQGVEWLCQRGVMPIISVFRPVDNIELRSVLPLSNEELVSVFQRASEIANQYGLILGPTCTACQNNTLSFLTTITYNCNDFITSKS